MNSREKKSQSQLNWFTCFIGSTFRSSKHRRKIRTERNDVGCSNDVAIRIVSGRFNWDDVTYSEMFFCFFFFMFFVFDFFSFALAYFSDESTKLNDEINSLIFNSHHFRIVFAGWKTDRLAKRWIKRKRKRTKRLHFGEDERERARECIDEPNSKRKWKARKQIRDHRFNVWYAFCVTHIHCWSLTVGERCKSTQLHINFELKNVHRSIIDFGWLSTDDKLFVLTLGNDKRIVDVDRTIYHFDLVLFSFFEMFDVNMMHISCCLLCDGEWNEDYFSNNKIGWRQTGIYHCINYMNWNRAEQNC